MSRVLFRKLILALSVAAFAPAGPVGCKKKGVALADGTPHPSASAAKTQEPARCAEVERGAVFTVGDSEGGGGGDEEHKGLPFAVEVGAASAWAGGFVIGAQRARENGTSALLALTGMDAGSGRIIDLGNVHGNVGAPRVAARGNDIVAAVPDGDGTGTRLRLAAIRDPAGRADLVWGAEIPQGRDDSDEFDLAISDASGLVVWDEWDSSSGRSQIQAVTFHAKDLGRPAKRRVISAPKGDAEGPRLAVRPGGFWLAYIAHEADDPPESRGGVARPRPDEEEIGGSVVELGRRRLKLVPLDANASPVGAPVGITDEERHVLVYDLAKLPDGAALLAWRSDDTSPGVEGGTVHVARVGLDGAVSRSSIEGRDIGAGVPGLVADSAGGAGVWLAMAGAGDDTALGALGLEGKPLEDLDTDPLVRSAEPLALANDRLLIARPTGLSVELSVVRCRPATGGRKLAPVAPIPEPAPVEDILDERPR